MAKRPHPCPGCGGPTWGELCHPCRRARWTRPCEECGESFTHPDRRQRFCSQACGRASSLASSGQPRAASKRRDCEVCGTDYVYTYFAQRTCSRECGAELRRRVYGFAGHSPPTSLKNIVCLIYHHNCTECGKLFIARRRIRRACSPECARRRQIKQVLDRHYGYVANGENEASLLDYLKARDRGRCGICRKPVRARRGERGPSIDHIVPRSCWPEGVPGVDDKSNLQLAHLECNKRKNNRGGGEQLLLVG